MVGVGVLEGELASRFPNEAESVSLVIHTGQSTMSAIAGINERRRQQAQSACGSFEGRADC